MEQVKKVLENVEFEVIKKDDTATIKVKDHGAFVEAAKEVNEAFTSKLLKELEDFQDAYLNVGLDIAKDKALEAFKDGSAKAEVVLPFGVNKSDVATYNITKEKTFPIPGKSEKITKPVIRLEVKKTGCKLSKTRIKSMESDIAEALGM